MKRVFDIGVFLLVCSMGWTQAANPACIPADCSKNWYYKQMCKIVNAHNQKQTVPILFIGDSITHLWLFAKDHKHHGGLDSWNKYFVSKGAVNFGITAQRTEHVLWRVTDGGQLKINPELIVLLIGTNNLHRSPRPDSAKQVAEGIKAILDVIKVKAPQSKVLLLGILPRNWDSSAKRKVGEVNAIISSYADNKRIFYFDAGPALLDKYGKISKTVFRDGIHLTPYGYELFAKTLLTEIEKIQAIKK